MMNVEKIYDDIRLRSNIEKWKELFKDDLCTQTPHRQYHFADI